MTNGKTKQPTKFLSGGVFAGVAAVWLIVDQLTKHYFQSAYTLGQTSATDFVLFRFRLVHNTGAAWGMFGDSTFALGVVSCLTCLAIVLVLAFYPRLMGRRASLGEVAALALVFSGGVGNAIDRFVQAYVVDFIEFTFIDFPVFNVADIGVTCGFVLVVLAFLMAERAHNAQLAAEEGGKEALSD